MENLDLGETCLDNLELDMTGIRKLVLPKNTRSLKLYGEFRLDLQVDDSLCSGKIALEISLKKALLQRYGLQKNRVQRLRLTDIKELDMKQVVGQFPEAECILHGEYGRADEKEAPVTLSEIWDVMDEVRENW